MTISIVKESDLKEFTKVRLLAHKYSAQFDKDVVVTDDTFKELINLTEKEFEDPRIVYLLAKEGDELAGIAIISIATNIDKTAFVAELFVKKRYRRRGVGRKLIERASEITKKKGLNKIQITVVSKNKQAQKFYSNFGFRRKKRDYILLEKKI